MKPDLRVVESAQPAPPPVEPPPEQAEMPFAIVEGEPLTELPRDLYIPPQALEVFLEAFEGPLDLLLYLIRRQNLDILDIPIAEITRQYMEYIELMQELELELAGEYLLMAAMLAEIKSRMLLPRAHRRAGGGRGSARRAGAPAAGVRALQEGGRGYRRPATPGARRVDRPPRKLTERKVVRLVPEVTLQEMLVAFKEVLAPRRRCSPTTMCSASRCRCASACRRCSRSLRASSFVEFIHLFRPEEGRMGVTVTFVAILELAREELHRDRAGRSLRADSRAAAEAGVPNLMRRGRQHRRGPLSGG